MISGKTIALCRQPQLLRLLYGALIPLGEATAKSLPGGLQTLFWVRFLFRSNPKRCPIGYAVDAQRLSFFNPGQKVFSALFRQLSEAEVGRKGLAYFCRCACLLAPLKQGDLAKDT